MEDENYDVECVGGDGVKRTKKKLNKMVNSRERETPTSSAQGRQVGKLFMAQLSFVSWNILKGTRDFLLINKRIEAVEYMLLIPPNCASRTLIVYRGSVS